MTACHASLANELNGRCREVLWYFTILLNFSPGPSFGFRQTLEVFLKAMATKVDYLSPRKPMTL